MANRHRHKKLRAEIRARMALTGESYQAAHGRVSTLRAARDLHSKDIPELFATTYFGVPITVAAYRILSHVRLILVSGSGGPIGLPWGGLSPICVHPHGLQ